MSRKSQTRKIDKVEKDKRIRIVQEWLLEEWPSQDIIAQIKAQWQVEDRQAKRYLADARAAWNEEEGEKVEQKRRRKIIKMQKLIRTMGKVWQGTPQGIRAILMVEKFISELDGTKPASKVQLTGADGGPIKTENSVVPDLSKLSKEELKTIIAISKKAT